MYPAEQDSHEALLKRAQRRMRLLTWMSPGIDAIHAIDARFPQECIAITALSFESYLFQTMCDVKGYQKWLDSQDLYGSYCWHRRFLQHLQYGSEPGTWILKAPAHLFALDAIDRVYPDARFIQLYRDPLQAITSTASLTYHLRRAFSDAVDPLAIGREVTARWLSATDLAARTRRSQPELNERFLDVSYNDLVRDPLQTLSRIYSRLDLETDEQSTSAVKSWLSKNPKGRYGTHEYDARFFDINRDEVCSSPSNYWPVFSAE